MKTSSNLKIAKASMKRLRVLSTVYYSAF